MTDPNPINPDTGRRLRPGRPQKLNDDLVDRIGQVVRAGNFLRTAAQYCGVSEASLHAWLARGRKVAAEADTHGDTVYCPNCNNPRGPDPDTPLAADACELCGSTLNPRVWEPVGMDRLCLRLLETVTQASVAAEVAAVTHWRAAFANDWRAARDYLSRSAPERWGATTRLALSNDEAETRINAAVTEALTALGVDTDPVDPGADPDPTTAAFADLPAFGTAWDDDDGEPTDD